MTCLLSASVEQIAAMTPAARAARVDLLTLESHAILDAGIRQFVHADGKELAGVCILYSGGDDSTVLTHLLRARADYLVHANTGIGIEATRQFVRDTAAAWGIPLLEKHPPPGSTYEEIVLEWGFPGPGYHWRMYQRLKERCLRQVRRDLVTSRAQRVVFVAGRRREESQRRMRIPEFEREGSTVWISPLVHWTKLDLNTYRQLHPDCPRNPVAALLHMSGECLCGSFAHAGELEEIAAWFPETAAYIHDLEHRVAASPAVVDRQPWYKCRWGWGERLAAGEITEEAWREIQDDPEFAPSASGPMCSSCEYRFGAGGA